MTLREKCAQMLHVACDFPDEDPDRTSQLVRKDGVGGLLLTGGSVFDVPSFVNWAQKVAKYPLLISADFERSGPVTGGTLYPPDAAIAATKSADFAQTKARHLGAEARALGIRMLLGPSVDDPLAAAAIEGYHYSRVAVCLKRFPDAGVRLHGGKAEALLIGHEVVPDSDEEAIASLSRTAIQGLLRRELRFEGLAVTDALSRLGTSVDLVVRAANAGADVLLRPADAGKAIDALEAAAKDGRIATSTIDRAVMRQFLTKERLGLFADRMVDIGGVEKTVGCPTHKAAADRISFVVSQLRR
jgi:beta-N-acetylhexosaminidase